MGNSLTNKRANFCNGNTKFDRSDNPAILNLDPRSPTEGIMRTPIHIDAVEGHKSCTDPRSPTNGVNRTPLGHIPSNDLVSGDMCLFDMNTFETLDGFLTDDDSIHRKDVTGDAASAYSDTELSIKLKKECAADQRGPVSRLRRSFMEKRVKRSAAKDSPGFFMMMRHKQNCDRHLSRQNRQHGDGRTVNDSGYLDAQVK